MNVLVLGHSALEHARAAARCRDVALASAADSTESAARTLARALAVDNWSAEPVRALRETNAEGVILAGDLDGASDLARIALDAGKRVILADLPRSAAPEWLDLAKRAEPSIILSRRLRFDRLFAGAKDALRAGTVGAPRTIHIGWSFPSSAGSGDQGSAATAGELTRRASELADVALWLLEAEPDAMYAIPCGVEGAPLLELNLRASDGRIASIEVSLGSDGYPPLRDLSLLARDGAVYHRTNHDDLLWSDGRGEFLLYTDDALEREVAAWLASSPEARRDHARGDALRRNLAIVDAIEASLRQDEPVAVGEVGT